MTLYPPRLEGVALCWGCVPDASILELAALGARYRFPEIHVQPAQDRSAGMSGGDLAARLKDMEVRVGVVDAVMSGLPGLPHPDEVHPEWRAPYLIRVDQCVEAAVTLGARTLNVAHALGTPVDYSMMADAVGRIAEQAAAANLRIALEFIPGTGFPDFPSTLEIIRRVGREDVGVLLDTWHLARSGGNSDELLAFGADRIFEAQISGRREPPPGEPYIPMTGRLAPGEGEESVNEVVRTLRRLRPDLILAVEVFTAERDDPDLTVARLAAATSSFLDTMERP